MNRPPGRIAGIDYGTRRIGIAVTDPAQSIASPYETYSRGDEAADRRRFRRLVEEERIARFVVGVPVHLDGRESEKSREARKFGAWLAETTGVEVEYFDERFTTHEAELYAGRAQLTKKKRKERLDKLAAQIMLSAYLESRRNASPIARTNRPWGWTIDGAHGETDLRLRVHGKARGPAAGATQGAGIRGDAQRRACPRVREQGYTPIVADVMQPASLRDLPAAETVLYAVGYDRSAGVAIARVYVDGLQAVLAALPAATGKFIYISSTGVYGQSQGEWVDETSVCEPTREGGRACLAAERALAATPFGPRCLILRMAGMYGPGRIPNADEIRSGGTIAVPAAGYLNLIHVDDAAEVVLAAERRAAVPRSYVVSDGHPVERRAYYEELARLLDAPPPQFMPPPADAPAAVRSGTSKRVDNARMVAELSVALAYPSFREGLAAIVAAEAT